MTPDRFTEAELEALNSTAIGRKALRRMREDEAMMAALRAENDRLGAMRFAPQPAAYTENIFPR